MLLRRLHELERQLALTQKQVDDEYRRIADLQGNKLESSMAADLLHTLFAAHRAYENERDSILDSLAKEPSSDF
jgi:hypothetical protein